MFDNDSVDGVIDRDGLVRFPMLWKGPEDF
jgi:hypothetical protein